MGFEAIRKKEKDDRGVKGGESITSLLLGSAERDNQAEKKKGGAFRPALGKEKKKKTLLTSVTENKPDRPHRGGYPQDGMVT